MASSPYQTPGAELGSPVQFVEEDLFGWRHLAANALLFVVYLAVCMAITWIDVKAVALGPIPDRWLDTLAPGLLLSAIPVTWYVNWRLTRAVGKWRRLAISAAIAAGALAIAFVPFCVIGIQFHLVIGGSL